MHVELRNGLPYVYKTERDLTGKVRNIYVGKLDEVLASHRRRNGFTPTVGITKFGQKADISVSMHDHSQKSALTRILVATKESENTRRDRVKEKRNEAVLVARSMAKAGIPYDRIAHELTTIMKKPIGKGTAHKWANTAKLSQEYYDPAQDSDKIAMEKRISNEIEHDRDD